MSHHFLANVQLLIAQDRVLKGSVIKFIQRNHQEKSSVDKSRRLEV